MRWQKATETLENLLGQQVPAEIRKELTRGADELDLVRSGLDDAMRVGYQNIREIMLTRKGVDDLRTAAFVLAIEKIATSYQQMGL